MSKKHQYIVSSRDGQTAIPRKERRKVSEFLIGEAKKKKRKKKKQSLLGDPNYGIPGHR